MTLPTAAQTATARGAARSGTGRCGIRLPDRVNCFTPAGLRAMAAKAGFDLTVENPLNLSFDDNIHALLRKRAVN